MTNQPKEEKEHTSKAWMGIGCFMLPIAVFFLVVIFYFIRLAMAFINTPAVN